MSRSKKSGRTWWIVLAVFVVLGVVIECCCAVVVFFSLEQNLSGVAGMPEPTMAYLPTATIAVPAIVPPTPTSQPQLTVVFVPPGEPLPAAAPTSQSQPTSAPTAQPSLQEARTLTIEWPPVIRAGDSDIIRLTLEVNEMGNIAPTVEIEGHTVTGETIFIPNLYDTHNVVAEARLDLAGMQVSPAELSSQVLLPGQRVTFYWSVHPEEVGKYLGVVWFHLRFVPLDGGPESERVVAAQQIEIQVVSFLGLKAGPARILGVVGGFLSSVFGMPFLEDGLKWGWKRFRKGK